PRPSRPARRVCTKTGRSGLRGHRRETDVPLLPALRAGQLRRPAPESPGPDLAPVQAAAIPAGDHERRGCGGDLPADRGRGRQILAPAAEGGLGATQFLVVFANAETTLSGLELERRRSVCYAPLLDGLDQD